MTALSLRNFSYEALSSPLTSGSTPSTVPPIAEIRCWRLLSEAASSTQGWHHDAQKFSTTTWPRRSERCMVLPFIVNVKSLGGWPWTLGSPSRYAGDTNTTIRAMTKSAMRPVMSFCFKSADSRFYNNNASAKFLRAPSRAARGLDSHLFPAIISRQAEPVPAALKALRTGSLRESFGVLSDPIRSKVRRSQRQVQLRERA